MQASENRRRSLLTYAFVSHSLGDQRDILLGLTPLFRPIADAQAGQVFSPQKFADLVSEHYGLSMHTIVAEEFVPRLLKAGLLTTQGENVKQGTYLYKSAPKSQHEQEREGQIEASLNAVLNAFESFVEAFPTLITLTLSRNNLEDLLFDWLISSQTVGLEELLSPNGEEASGETPPDVHQVAGFRYRSEGEYLCARFVAKLQSDNPKLFDELAKIAAGAPASEVILDLRNPPEVGRRVNDLTVLLDGPFVMDLLGLTGKERADNSSYIFESLKQMGARLGTYEHSCEEIRGNLRGVLKKPIPQRVGPTGDALRKGEANEVYAIEVMNDVEGFVKAKDIVIFDKNVIAPPGDARFFTDEQMEGFGEELREWTNDLARERDVLSIALIMRRRRGHRTNDAFDAKYLFLSHNPALVRHARRFCVEEFLIRESHVPPAIHQRRMAALLWLTLGSVQRLALSRKQLIANCANALRSRPDVIQSMRETLASFKPELKQQFDALLTRPRSVQIVMDLTLGVQEVVGPEQAEQMFEIVKQSAAEEEKAKFDRKLAEARERFGKALTSKELTLKQVTDENARTKAELEDAISRDKKMFKGWVERTQRLGATIYDAIRLLASLIILLVIVFGAATVETPLGTLGNWAAAVLTAILSVYPIWGVELSFVGRRILHWKERRLAKLLSEADREDLARYAEVDWKDGSTQWFGRYGREGLSIEEGNLL